MHQPWSRAVLVETVDAYARASWDAGCVEGGARAASARRTASSSARRRRRCASRSPVAASARRCSSRSKCSGATRRCGACRPRSPGSPASERTSARAGTRSRQHAGRDDPADRPRRDRRRRRPRRLHRRPVGRRRSSPPAVEDRAPIAARRRRCSSPATTRSRSSRCIDRSQRSGPAGRRHRRDRCRPVRRPPSPQLAARLDHVVDAVRRGRRAARRRHRRQAAGRPLHRGRGLGAVPRRARRAQRGDRAWRAPGAHVRVAGEASPTCSTQRGLDRVLVVTDPYHALRSPPDRRGRRADGLRVADAERRWSAAATSVRRHLAEAAGVAARPDHRLRPPLTDPPSADSAGVPNGPTAGRPALRWSPVHCTVAPMGSGVTGNTADSGSVIRGSIPLSPARRGCARW